MNFKPSEEQTILKDSARDFLKKECPKEATREILAGEDGYSPDLWSKMAELGWMGLAIPEEYDGVGFSFFDLCLLLEEMGYNLCPGPFFSTVVLGGLTILNHGSEAMKRDLLPRVASGEMKITLALNEADGRYAEDAVQAVAVREGGEYVLSGTKRFVPFAHTADLILCPARTGGAVTLLAVAGGAPGIDMKPHRTLTGEKQFQVTFDQVRVPADSIVGSENEGWGVIRDVLEKASLGLAAEMVGGAKAAFNLALAYAKERTQFGVQIGSFQAVQHHLANMWVDLFAADHLTYRAATLIADGRPAGAEASMAKARAGDSYRRVTKLAHQIFGAIGFCEEHDLHLYHRRSVCHDQTFENADAHREKVAVSLGL